MLVAAAKLGETLGRHAEGARKAVAKGTIEMSAVSARHFAIVSGPRNSLWPTRSRREAADTNPRGSVRAQAHRTRSPRVGVLRAGFLLQGRSALPSGGCCACCVLHAMPGVPVFYTVLCTFNLLQARDRLNLINNFRGKLRAGRW